MPYAEKWDQLQEVEVLPNNFRVSVAGLKVGLNRIRWVHPTTTPSHKHDDAEQAIIMVEGKIKMVIEDEELVLEPGHVCVVPLGAQHYGGTMDQDALFYEIFAPLRVHNLIGYLGKIF